MQQYRGNTKQERCRITGRRYVSQILVVMAVRRG